MILAFLSYFFNRHFWTLWNPHIDVTQRDFTPIFCRKLVCQRNRWRWFWGAKLSCQIFQLLRILYEIMNCKKCTYLVELLKYLFCSVVILQCQVARAYIKICIIKKNNNNATTTIQKMQNKNIFYVSQMMNCLVYFYYCWSLTLHESDLYFNLKKKKEFELRENIEPTKDQMFENGFFSPSKFVL